MSKLSEIKLFSGEGLRGKGPLGLEGVTDATTAAPQTFNKFFSSFIGIITILSFFSFLILLITGAVSFMTAGGDKQKLETARSKITTAIIGLVIVIAAVFIIDFIAGLFGIDNILNPGQLLQDL